MTNLKDKAAAPPAPRYGSKRPAPPGVGSAGGSGEGVDLVSLSASPIEATRNHQQYGCWRSAPMPLDAPPVTSATGRMSASLRKRLNCRAAANCSDGPTSDIACLLGHLVGGMTQ